MGRPHRVDGTPTDAITWPGFARNASSADYGLKSAVLNLASSERSGVAGFYHRAIDSSDNRFFLRLWSRLASAETDLCECLGLLGKTKVIHLSL